MHIVNLQTTVTIGAAMTATMAMLVRMRSTNKPVNPRKLLIPPLAMSTGFLMFAVPFTRIPFTWGIAALLIGALLFSYPLIRYSQLEQREGHVYMKKSKVFAFILIGLLLIRVLLRQVIEQYVSLPQTGAIFFLLAFGMLLPWRLAMYAKFRKLQSQEAAN
ncbi:cytochrome c biogenesis protein CcdC [Paenibacillus sp. H1-7]|uniref:CcdC family protein n=1 Tax=Paenibacillus sp. H1-7 TaxID=2282849 RepID=UPI001EF98602|nr:cytochrome c biogenesis protein CcdC [Paenibacillus sp. H1-7]ULL18057.1 cytochrome c biogenesis protein CcdC [Paenibacillus sp. H1-7]